MCDSDKEVSWLTFHADFAPSTFTAVVGTEVTVITRLARIVCGVDVAGNTFSTRLPLGATDTRVRTIKAPAG